jgi:cell division protein FtsL
MMKHHRPFLVLWGLAVAASTTAFVLHLAMRGRTMHLGYQLGRERAEQGRLREVKRVLELEVSSYQTPQRVEMVARTLLDMQPPDADRIISMSGVRIRPTTPPAKAPTKNGVAHSPSGSAKLIKKNSRKRDKKLSDAVLPNVTPPKASKLDITKGQTP